MDPKENPGLSDETIGKFGEFIKMAEENLYLSEVETEEVPSQILETHGATTLVHCVFIGLYRKLCVRICLD